MSVAAELGNACEQAEKQPLLRALSAVASRDKTCQQWVKAKERLDLIVFEPDEKPLLQFLEKWPSPDAAFATLVWSVLTALIDGGQKATALRHLLDLLASSLNDGMFLSRVKNEIEEEYETRSQQWFDESGKHKKLPKIKPLARRSDVEALQNLGEIAMKTVLTDYYASHVSFMPLSHRATALRTVLTMKYPGHDSTAKRICHNSGTIQDQDMRVKLLPKLWEQPNRPWVYLWQCITDNPTYWLNLPEVPVPMLFSELTRLDTGEWIEEYFTPCIYSNALASFSLWNDQRPPNEFETQEQNMYLGQNFLEFLPLQLRPRIVKPHVWGNLDYCCVVRQRWYNPGTSAGLIKLRFYVAGPTACIQPSK